MLAAARASICEQPDQLGFGHQLAQQLQPLRPDFNVEQCNAGDIAARPVEAGNEAGLDRVLASRKHDRNFCRGGLGRSNRTTREYHSYPSAHEVCCHPR
jgi:hypothetical protein